MKKKMTKICHKLIKNFENSQKKLSEKRVKMSRKFAEQNTAKNTIVPDTSNWRDWNALDFIKSVL